MATATETTSETRPSAAVKQHAKENQRKKTTDAATKHAAKADFDQRRETDTGQEDQSTSGPDPKGTPSKTPDIAVEDSQDTMSRTNVDSAVHIPSQIVTDDKALVLGESNSLAFSATEEDGLIRKFDRDGHEDGMDARRGAAVSISAVLRTGAIIARRHEKEEARRGCKSRYGSWCATYLDFLGRKTCDRWRRAYLAFRDFLKDPQLAKELAPAFENLQLTALYKLSEVGVPQQAKEEALETAKRRPLTPLMAEAIIDGFGGRFSSPQSTKKQNPPTDKFEGNTDEGVRITVRFTKNGDQNKALRLAIKRLQKELEKANTA